MSQQSGRESLGHILHHAQDLPTNFPPHHTHHLQPYGSCMHSLIGAVPVVTGRIPNYHPEGVLRETPDDPLYLARAVKVEETTHVTHELPVIGEGRSIIRRHVETELRVPEVNVTFKEVQIESNEPNVIERYIEVPQIVEKEIIIPTPKKIVEQVQHVKKYIPKIIIHETEKIIEKKIRTERPVIVYIDKPTSEIGTPKLQSVPVIISKRPGNVNTRFEGKIEFPITRYVPKIIPVDIDVPVSNDEALNLLKRHSTVRVVREHLEAIDPTNTDVDVNYDKKNDLPNWEFHILGDSTLTGTIIEYDTTTCRKLSPGHFNSWTRKLNEHLYEHKQYLNLLITKYGKNEWEKNIVPFMKSPDGSIPFLGPNEELLGDVRD